MGLPVDRDQEHGIRAGAAGRLHATRAGEAGKRFGMLFVGYSGRDTSILKALNDVLAAPSGDISHVIIWNPHRVLRYHYQQKTAGMVEG